MAPRLSDGHNPAAGRARSWTGRRRGGVVGNWVFTTLVRYGGLWPAYGLLAFVAAYFVLFAPKARRASAEYRRRIGFRQGSCLSRLWGAYCHFFSFGQILLDRYAFISGHADWFRFEFVGEEHIRSALAKGKGVIIISAHCGNWEAAGHFLQQFGVPVNIVGYEGERPDIQSLFDPAEQNQPVRFINADGSAAGVVALIAALRRGEVAAMLADRIVNEAGVRVPFLGAPARFPRGPYIVAALSGVPLIHAFATREGIRHYRLTAYRPEDLTAATGRGDREALEKWVGQFAGRVEEVLRGHPLQWHNFFDFWSGGEHEGEGAASWVGTRHRLPL